MASTFRILGFTALGALMAIAATWIAAADDGQRRVTTQTWHFDDGASTSSPRWRDVRTLSLEGRCPERLGAVEVSMNLKGRAPVQLRVQVYPDRAAQNDPSAARLMKPRRVSVSVRGADAVTYTFTKHVSGGGHGPKYDVQWRSPTGARVTMLSGVAVLMWDPLPPTAECG